MGTRIACGLVLVFAPAAAADDSPAAAYARTTQLKAPITVEQTATPLIDFLKIVAGSVERSGKVKAPKWTYAPGVDRAKPVTYKCDNKPLAEVLDEVFKGQGLGYVIVSADGEKFDGFFRIAAGADRGTEAAATPPPDPKAPAGDDKLAAARLKAAKGLIESGDKVRAKALLELLVKRHPDTAVGKEAATLLEGLDK